MMGLREDIKKPGAPVVLYVDDILGYGDSHTGNVIEIAQRNINRVAKVLGFEDSVNVVYSDSATEAEKWVDDPKNAERVVLAIVDNDFGFVREGLRGAELADDVEQHNHNRHAEILWCSNLTPTAKEAEALQEVSEHGAYIHMGPHEGRDHHFIRSAILTGLPKLSDHDIEVLATHDPDIFPRDDHDNRALCSVVQHLQRAFSRIRHSDLKAEGAQAHMTKQPTDAESPQDEAKNPLNQKHTRYGGLT